MYITLETEDIVLGTLKLLSISEPDVPWELEDIKELIDPRDVRYDPTVAIKVKAQIKRWLWKCYEVSIDSNIDIVFVGNNTIIINTQKRDY